MANMGFNEEDSASSSNETIEVYSKDKTKVLNEIASHVSELINKIERELPQLGNATTNLRLLSSVEDLALKTPNTSSSSLTRIESMHWTTSANANTYSSVESVKENLIKKIQSFSEVINKSMEELKLNGDYSGENQIGWTETSTTLDKSVEHMQLTDLRCVSCSVVTLVTLCSMIFLLWVVYILWNCFYKIPEDSGTEGSDRANLYHERNTEHLQNKVNRFPTVFEKLRDWKIYFVKNINNLFSSKQKFPQNSSKSQYSIENILSSNIDVGYHPLRNDEPFDCNRYNKIVNRNNQNETRTYPKALIGSPTPFDGFTSTTGQFVFTDVKCVPELPKKIITIDIPKSNQFLVADQRDIRFCTGNDGIIGDTYFPNNSSPVPDKYKRKLNTDKIRKAKAKSFIELQNDNIYHYR